MRYLIDTQEKTIATVDIVSVDDFMSVRKFLRSYQRKGYTIALGYEPAAVSFNPPLYPDAAVDVPHLKRRIGYK